MICFDQDPAEQGNISGGDLEILIDYFAEMKKTSDELLNALKPFAAGYDTPEFRNAAVKAVANAEQKL